MGISATALGGIATAATAQADRVVIVGAGPAGMATAIELAQNGIRSTVLEARGEVAGRQTLFNVVPALADRLAALAPDGSLTSTLVPTSRFDVSSQVSGRSVSRTFEGGLEYRPDAGRGDMHAVLNAANNNVAPDQLDTRRWSKVGIGDLENAMRSYAVREHGDMIDVRYGAKVLGIGQDARGAMATVEGSDQAVRGAMLIDASGRDLLGAERTVYPEQVHWLGGIYPHARTLDAPADGFPVQRVYTKGPAGPDGVAGTMALHHDDRTIVWTEVPGPGKDVAPDDARALIAERAAKVGVDQPLPSDAAPIPVTTQLWTSNEPARGRILAVGDSVRAPYFMTSTGAASALVHDAPQAVDAVRGVLAGTSTPEHAAAAYTDSVRGANEALTKFVRGRILEDIGIRRKDAAAPIIQPAR